MIEQAICRDSIMVVQLFCKKIIQRLFILIVALMFKFGYCEF